MVKKVYPYLAGAMTEKNVTMLLPDTTLGRRTFTCYLCRVGKMPGQD